MTKNAGFTLIELLVVVLIIGILSAVALPQYQKTVLKSRTSEAWTNLSALHTAVKLYCLENPDGDSVSLEDLSVEVKDSKNFKYDVSYTSCKYDSYSLSATWQGEGKFSLGFSSRLGRQCKGEKCKDLGFSSSSYDLGFRCFCGGVTDKGYGCYYME